MKMIRIVSSFLLIFLISEIKAVHYITCDIIERSDPFDRGFQTERTKTTLCAFNEVTHITEPAVLANTVNKDVTRLEMANNKKIEFLPQDISVPFPNLFYIDVFNCSVKSLSYDNFKGLSKLFGIYLRRNELVTIDENSFDDLVELRYVSLDENKIVDLPSKIFEKLEHLDELFLNSNQLSNLDAQLFKNNKKIALLHINENKIKSLPSGIFDGFTLMRQLWLKNNEIEDVPPHIFDTCESLIDLDLSGNKIKTIDTNLLSKLDALMDVSFSFNPLEFVDFSIFDNKEHLTRIWFDGVSTKDIRNIEKVDSIKVTLGLGLTIGFEDTCVDGKFHEGNLDELKKAVKEKCIDKLE